MHRQLSLQAAYAISDEPQSRPVSRIFYALDRLSADLTDINESSRDQRNEAIQRLAVELDARRVPLRDPAIERAAVDEMRRLLAEDDVARRQAS